MIKAVIFDLDGTLLDSMPYWKGLAGQCLRDIGIEPRENIDEEVKTFTFRQSAEYFREKYGVTLSVNEMLDIMNKVIGDRYKYDIPLKAGAEELLRRLSARGIKMCVATSSERTNALAALTRLGVIDYFSEILTCSDLNCDKTEPTIYRVAADKLGVKREETAVVEDALYALRTAKKDGFVAVAVFDPSEPEGDEMRELADYYVTELSELNI